MEDISYRKYCIQKAKEMFKDVMLDLEYDHELVVNFPIKYINAILNIFYDYYLENGYQKDFLLLMFKFLQAIKKEAIEVHYQFDINYFIYQINFYLDILKIEDDNKKVLIKKLNTISKEDDKV